jgi:hypothetical protein
MSREGSERFMRSRRPHIFEAHHQEHGSIDRLVRSGKAPRFESMIHSRDIAATRKGSDRPSGHGTGGVWYLIEIVRMPPAQMNRCSCAGKRSHAPDAGVSPNLDLPIIIPAIVAIMRKA